MDFQRGEIIFDPKFVYPGGGKPCDKYLLILNKKHQPNDNLILVPAKTNTSIFPYKPNCNDDVKEFYIKDTMGFYYPNTIIQLNQIVSWEYLKVEEMINSKRLFKHARKTSQQEISLIIACLKKIKDDIPISFQSLIF